MIYKFVSFALGLLISFQVDSTTVFGQQNHSSENLNTSWNLPQPDSSKMMSSIFIINEQPKILSVFKPSINSDLMLPAIAFSNFKKGKIILFGSSEYFKKPMLGRPEVIKTFLNLLPLNKSNSKKNSLVAIYGSNEDLKQFLESKTNFYALEKSPIRKNTAMIFVTQDVIDSRELNKIEKYIKSGGTLVFGSPYGEIERYSKGNVEVFNNLSINSLFLKAGFFNAPNRLFNGRETAKTLSMEIPNYLYPDSLLKLLSTDFPDKVDYYFRPFFIDPAIRLIFENNEINSKILTKVRRDFRYADSVLLPSRQHPLIINTNELRWGYTFNRLLAKKRYLNNPLAVAQNYKNFPGAASINNPTNKTEDVMIHVQVGSQGLSEPQEPYFRLHSTGLYIPAGKKVTINLDTLYLKQKLKAQIGVHSDDLTHLDSVSRDGFDLTENFELERMSTKIYSPYGGLLLIRIPDTSTLDTVKISVNGALRAPFFELNRTTREQWRKISKYPSPWAELKTDNIVLTIPSTKIRMLEDPEELLKFWDKVMDADAELAAISKHRTHPERIIVDSDVAFGYMFTTRDKIVVPDDESCQLMLNKDSLAKNGSWGHFHEIGHRHQFKDLDFSGLTEVSVNLFTLYTYNQVLGRGVLENEKFPSREALHKRIDEYFKNSPSFINWQRDPFVALSMYVQIIDKFGWEPIKEVYKQYRTLSKESYPKSNDDKRDLWFTSISKATKSDLTEFFEVWQIPISSSAKKEVKGLDTWIPDYMSKYKR